MRKIKFIGTYKGIDAEGSLQIIPDRYGLEGLQDIEPDTQVSVEISKPRKSRTLAQNGYFWQLVKEINLAENGRCTEDDKIELYKKILVASGVKPTPMAINAELFSEIIKRLDHLRGYVITGGFWQDGIQYLQTDLYFGISRYDREEMGSIINYILEYASEVGIDPEYWKVRLLYE